MGVLQSEEDLNVICLIPSLITIKFQDFFSPKAEKLICGTTSSKFAAVCCMTASGI